MPALYLTEADVRELLDMEIAIDVVEEAFRQLAGGGAMNVPRARAHAEGIYLHTMSAVAQYLGCAGWKAYTTTSPHARFHVRLYSSQPPEIPAAVQGSYLGQLGTSAARAGAPGGAVRPCATALSL